MFDLNILFPTNLSKATQDCVSCKSITYVMLCGHTACHV